MSKLPASGVANWEARDGGMPPPTSISQPSKVQMFQFQTSGILVFKDV